MEHSWTFFVVLRFIKIIRFVNRSDKLNQSNEELEHEIRIKKDSCEQLNEEIQLLQEQVTNSTPDGSLSFD